ncbi:hypothetical protein G3I77_37170 [Streptomyces sp. D2-8]|uniref:hypothetical protein n=1 Tax=Streptomyces sp. D2-8 TaxID=2707767 RepID=UPI0020BF24D6|nr:hypothetical protein [Streptomyces sp. D2-8]MCK8438438.1 hypothetical protein [Streptomyces sp. D2-8]
MKDADVLASFDGRGRTEFLLGGFEGRHSDKITAMGYELGYDLQPPRCRARARSA